MPPAILAGLTAAEEEVAAIAGLRAGRVRLVSFPSGSSTLVPTALAAMRAAHPGTRISLVEAEPPRSVEMLREGDCDLALAFRYGGAAGSAAEWEDLVVRPLLTDRLIGLVPDGHRLAGAGQVGMAELADDPWIAGCPRCRRHLVDVCEAVGFTPRIDFATDDYPAVVGLVGAGLGVAVLPELAVESVRAKGVSTLVVEPAVEREVVALTLPDLARVPHGGRDPGRAGAGRAALRGGRIGPPREGPYGGTAGRVATRAGGGAPVRAAGLKETFLRAFRDPLSAERSARSRSGSRWSRGSGDGVRGPSVLRVRPRSGRPTPRRARGRRVRARRIQNAPGIACRPL